MAIAAGDPRSICVGKPLSAAPEKLRLLADWFDATHDSPDTEVQEDLRHWADVIEKLVSGIVDVAVEEAERR